MWSLPDKSVIPEKARPVSILLAASGVIVSVVAGLFIAGMANILQVLIVIIGAVAFIVTFTRMEISMGVMVFILYTQAYIIAGERYGVTDVVQGMIMLIALSMVTRWFVYQYEIPQGWVRPVFLVGFYCMICLASVFYAADPSVSLPVAVETIKSGIIALIIAILIRSENTFRYVIWMLLAAGIFLGSLSVWQFLTGSYENDYSGFATAALQNISGETNDYRMGGPVGDPNFYAQMMLVLVPIALERVWHEKTLLLRALALWALAACAFAVFLTYSRGGFLAMLVTVFLMLLISRRGQIRYFLLIAAVALLLINVLPARFTQRLDTLSELFPSADKKSALVAKDYSFRGRTSEMLVALQMFSNHPILGVGLGNYGILYQSYSQRLGLDFRSEQRQAHSLYLEVASETGLLGIFSFGLLLAAMLRSLWVSRLRLERHGLFSLSNMMTAFMLGYIGYLTAALFIHSAYPRNFWVLAGVALCAPRLTESALEALAIREKKVLGYYSSQAAREE